MAVVVITGSARGIGLATAQHLATIGWQVVGIDVQPPEDRDPFSLFLQEDLTAPDTPATIVATVVRRLGGIDGLVNNAVVVTTGPFLEVEPEDLDRSVEVNVRGMFRITQAVVRSMVDARVSGSIVNISSVDAERGVRLTSVYSATKGFVAALTRCLAVELAQFGIRVNAVAPSTVDTKRVLSTITPEMRDERIRRIPLGRFASPEEVAEGVGFLLGDTSRFLTGVILPIDGGYLAFGS